MDCDKDTFTLFYDNKDVEVDTICEGRDIKFLVHLPTGDVILEMVLDKENGMHYWCEVDNGETPLATQI